MAPPVDAESLALSALADEPPAKELDTPVEQRTIAMTCEVCEHQWTEPFAKAGKQTLCPECKRRQKVPELKLEQTEDWRQQRSKLPTLAKPKEEHLEGVQASTVTQNVSISSMEEAGAIEEELDPLPMSYRLVIYGIPLLLVLGLMGGAVTWMMGRGEKEQVDFIAKALDEFEKNPPDMQPPAVTNSLMHGTLETAAGEYHARNIKTAADLDRARTHFLRAQTDLRLVKPLDRRRADRNALLGEVALGVLWLGGTEDEVKAETRYRWLPDTSSTRLGRINERVRTVHEELQHVLEPLKADADFDFRLAIARRLTRELVRRGQVESARNLVVQLFNPPEQPEAKAVIALEIHRLDPSSPVPKQFADELEKPIVDSFMAKKGKTTNVVPFDPWPSSAQALWKLYPRVKAPFDWQFPKSDIKLQEAYVRAAVVEMLLEPGKTADAVALTTKHADKLETRMRGLLQIAEWSAEPVPALEAAASLSKDTKLLLQALKPAEQPRFASVVYRLSQLAAENGKFEEAKTLAGILPEGGFREWAMGEIIRQKLAKSTDSVEPTLPELPDDRAKWCVGHAWNALAIARQAGRNKVDKAKLADWPSGVMHPFALAGLALGMQDLGIAP